MIGWPLECGQRELFALVGEEAAAIGVALLPSGQMRPCKSLSMVVAIGRGSNDAAFRRCEWCSMRASCRFSAEHGQLAGGRQNSFP
jgi:hypothetical protein